MGFIVGKTAFLLLGATLLLSGCMGLGEAEAEQPVPMPSVPDQPGTCGAGELAHLIGKDRSAISGMRFAHPLRVIAPGQPVTMDFNPDRLNIQLTKSDKIAAITCG